jgi:8-oxo-dGTP pyrophosphatase MutT (NUDIX family)
MNPDVLHSASSPLLRPSTELGDVAALIFGLDLDAPQAATRATMLQFAASHADALERTCAPGHFTGSALVVDATGERTLMLFHRKLQRWLQPGGHADGDANLAAVALKEATEETGIAGLLVDPSPIDLDIHEVAPPGEPPHRHLDIRFLVVAPAGAVEQGNHESEALRWVTVDELAELGVDEGTVRLAHAGFTRARSR